MDNTIVNPSTSLTLFKEIRLGNEALPNLTIVQIEVPQTATGANAITSLGRNSRSRRRLLSSLPTAFKNEEDYSTNTLASSSGIHFGESKRYPRSIQWRILRERKVLELRAADLSKRDRETKEATIALQLIFPSPLRNGCVALTDAEHPDFLNVFVVTKELDFLTFTVAKDFFCYAAASERDISTWCKVFRPASFHISQPYRLIAEKPLQVVVSLCDGRLLNLTRVAGADGSSWHESAHGQGKWAAMLGGLVRWQGSNTIKYDGISLDIETAIGLALSPDGKFVYAVCLNHTFKIWSLEKERSVFNTDLVGRERDLHEVAKLELDPGALNRIQIFSAGKKSDGDQYYVLTYSPQDLGQFKIWAIRDPDEGAQGVRDLFSEHTLRAPDPDPSVESKAIWTVVDFKVTQGDQGEEMDIWVLMKSNAEYRLFRLLCSLENFLADWAKNWSMTAHGTLDRTHPPDFSDAEPEAVTELWLDFILNHSRYPSTVLATALSMYCSARRFVAKPDPKASFRERLSSTVTSQIPLRPSDDGGGIFIRHREDINQEWTAFWQDIRDLTNARWKVLSLDYDNSGNIPWITFTDGCSAVRDCSRFEAIAHNTSAELERSMAPVESLSMEVDDGIREPRRLEKIAAVVEAAAAFRQSLGHPLGHKYKEILKAELWQDSLDSVPARMATCYDGFNFDQEIGDVEVGDLEARLEPIGGYGGLGTGIFLAIVNELPQVMIAEISGLLSTKLGLKALVEGALEMIDLHERVLLDLLVLVVFVNAEAEREEIPISDLDAASVYVALLEELRKYQLMQWLGRNMRAQKSDAPVDLSAKILAARERGREKGPHSLHTFAHTVLEDLFVVDVKPQSYTHQSQRAALTHSIQDILKWITGGNESAITLDVVLVHIQCNLLTNGNVDLASDFLRYQPSTAWATYIKGRLNLLKGEYEEASIHFKKAAFKLSRPSPSVDYHSASSNFLSIMEAAHLGQGLPTYYSHILSLFDTLKLPKWVSSFAHLALQFAPPPTDTNTNTEQSTNLLTSLFHSSLSLTDYETAYTTLLQHPDPPSLLPALITAMLSNNKATALIAFPFPPHLHPKIDAYLLQQARSPSSSSFSLFSSPSSYISPLDPHNHQSINKTNPPPNLHHILSSWRLAHHNIQGAAAALLERLDRLPDPYLTAGPTSATATKTTPTDRDAILETYLAVINLLSCAGEGWVLTGGWSASASGNGSAKDQTQSQPQPLMSGAGPGPGTGSGSEKDENPRARPNPKPKRKIVTLQDVRKRYQDELDRRSVIESGRFGFGFGFGEGEGEGEGMVMDVL